MSKPEEVVEKAAATLIELAERDGGIVLELVRVQAREGVGVAFYRQRPPRRASEPEAVIVLLDEESPGRWEALRAAYEPLGGSRSVTLRPSERGDWIVAVTGTAPAEASVAVVEFASLEHRVPVVDGFYAFTERVPVEPEEPPPTSGRFE